MEWKCVEDAEEEMRRLKWKFRQRWALGEHQQLWDTKRIGFQGQKLGWDEFPLKKVMKPEVERFLEDFSPEVCLQQPTFELERNSNSAWDWETFQIELSRTHTRLTLWSVFLCSFHVIKIYKNSTNQRSFSSSRFNSLPSTWYPVTWQHVISSVTLSAAQVSAIRNQSVPLHDMLHASTPPNLFTANSELNMVCNSTPRHMTWLPLPPQSSDFTAKTEHRNTRWNVLLHFIILLRPAFVGIVD